MVRVTDRFEAPDHYDGADLFISILDPGFRGFPLRGPRDRHCILRFGDDEHPDDEARARMDREVRRGLKWVRARGATLDTHIVVHCHAGDEVLALGAGCLGLDESFMALARVTNTRIVLEQAERFQF